jgi:hypothetical protein
MPASSSSMQQIDTAEAILDRESPAVCLETQTLVEAFAPLVEWKHWNRDQKRAVLASMIPDILVAKYKIESLGLSPAIFSNKDTHSAAGTFIAEPSLVYLPIPAA